MSDLTTVSRLMDAATVFAMELDQPGLVGRDAFGLLDRSTALDVLAAMSGHQPALLQQTRHRLVGCDAYAADELLATAALWAAFTGDA